MNRVVLHLIRSDKGGAGQYSMNIHYRMMELGYSSFVSINGERLLCPDGAMIKINRGRFTFAWNRLKRFVFKIFVQMFGKIDQRYVGFNLNERFQCHSPKDLLEVIPLLPTDIMVHWVSGYADAKYIADLQKATGAKLYYWMIDEAPLSGACHYPWDCEQYQSGCMDCPMTRSKIVKKAIRENFLHKLKYDVREKVMILPTEFDRIRMDKSLLWKGTPSYKMLEIVDEDEFSPAQNIEELRLHFNIPKGKHVVFFGCWTLDEERKGMSTLLKALEMIERDDMVCLVAGNRSDLFSGNNVISLGYVDIPTLIKAYQVADVFVCSSLEDSGPQMINQSLMCGTPVVAFEMGVALDIVKTGVTGYLAKWNDAKDMAIGIEMILDLDIGDYKIMATKCRQLALNSYSKKVFAKSIDEILKM